MLGRRSRAASQRAQVRDVAADGRGRFTRWTGNPIPEEKGGNMVQTSGIDQYKVGGRGARKDTEGEGK